MAHFRILWCLWENRIPDLLTVPLIPIPWLMIPNPRCCDPWSHPIVVMSENRIPDLLTVPLIPIPWVMIPNPRCCDPWSHPILCCRSQISYVSLQPRNRYTTQGLPEVSLPLEIRGVTWDFEDVCTEIKVGPLKVLQKREVAVGMFILLKWQTCVRQKCISCVFRRKFSVNKYEGKRNS